MTDQQGENKLDENKLDENKLIAERRAKLDSLREQGGVAFPNSFRPADTAGDLQANFGEKTKEITKPWQYKFNRTNLVNFKLQLGFGQQPATKVLIFGCRFLANQRFALWLPVADQTPTQIAT